MAKFCAASPPRIRHASSWNATSNTQCMLFSMPQCARTVLLIGSAIKYFKRHNEFPHRQSKIVLAQDSVQASAYTVLLRV